MRNRRWRRSQYQKHKDKWMNIFIYDWKCPELTNEEKFVGIKANTGRTCTCFVCKNKRYRDTRQKEKL